MGQCDGRRLTLGSSNDLHVGFPVVDHGQLHAIDCIAILASPDDVFHGEVGVVGQDHGDARLRGRSRRCQFAVQVCQRVHRSGSHADGKR